MARKNGKPENKIPQETKRAVAVILLCVIGLFLLLAAFGAAGIAGSDAYRLIASLLGVGYFLVPAIFFVLAAQALQPDREGFSPVKLLASALFFVSGLGFIEIVSDKGGLLGTLIAAPAIQYFDVYIALVGLGSISLIAMLLVLEGKISLEPFAGAWRLVRGLFGKLSKTPAAALEPAMTGIRMPAEEGDQDEDPVYEASKAAPIAAAAKAEAQEKLRAAQLIQSHFSAYTPPPLELLEKDRGRPGVGDIKGNATLIKRTLQNFGITVELDEISIGPSVTRYAVKPAEGVRLQKIVALQKNLELALSASSLRIEAPIPGKSLVGIEVPNSVKVTVGMGSLLESPDFAEAGGLLTVALGRDIAGSAKFTNLAKMPHGLIAGATGSGKSVVIHTLINSLLYRAGPAQLRFIFIDPKRVELTLYRSLPHLLTPVITDAKKAIAALRWAVKEMERRYTILEEKRVRDIESYHQNVLAPALGKIKNKDNATEGEEVPEAMPYIVIIIDELADIMQTYPRELEAAVVRLAQMSRAVGIHLILSTQRPSVNVITGLIKANVPARIALQVASQIDSRTILDQGGAESLLGRGDMLFLSSDMNKPMRLQGPFISEGEVKKIVDFISENNEPGLPIEIGVPAAGNDGVGLGSATGGGGGEFGDEEVDDEMVEAARRVVVESGKASTSFLQRRLSIGYARAARIMDVLEARGIIGPANGSKPRDILDKQSAPAPTGEPEEQV